MRVTNVNKNAIEFFKKNGRRIACTTAVGAMLFAPVSEVLAEENNETKTSENKNITVTINTHKYTDEEAMEKLRNRTYIDYEYDNVRKLQQELLKQFNDAEIDSVAKAIENGIPLILKENWQKTGSYNDGKSYIKENREYKRAIYVVTAKDNFNPDYFKGDSEKIFEFIRDEKKAGEIFNITRLDDEVKVVDEEEEKYVLDKDHWTIGIVGTDISVSIYTPEMAAAINKQNITMTIIMSVVFGSFGITLVVRHAKGYVL